MSSQLTKLTGASSVMGTRLRLRTAHTTAVNSKKMMPRAAQKSTSTAAPPAQGKSANRRMVSISQWKPPAVSTNPAHQPRKSARLKLGVLSMATSMGTEANQARTEKSKGVTARNHRQPLKVHKPKAL